MEESIRLLKDYDENENKKYLNEYKDKKDDVNPTGNTKCLDGGIGWAAVFGCFLAHFLLGINFSVGVLYVEIMESMDVTWGEAAWIGSLLVGTQCCSAPFMSSFEKFTTYRRMIWCGCILACSGVLLTYFVTIFPVILIGFGFIQGLGNSLNFMASIMAVNSHFDKKRSLAIAIGISGAGVGMTLHPTIEEILLSTYGLKGTFLINSAISLNYLVCGALYFPQKSETGKRFKKVSVTELFGSICNVHLFTNTFFIIFMILNILSLVGIYVFVGFLPSYVVEAGYSTEDASLMITMNGLLNSCGRLLWGYLCSKLHNRKYPMYAVVLCGTGSCLIAVTFCNTYATFMATSLIFGAFSGGMILMPAVTVADLFDRSLLSSAYAMMTMAQGIGSFAGNPIAGAISQAANNDDVVFYFGGCGTIACSILIIPLACCKASNSNAKMERPVTISVKKDKLILIESDYNLHTSKDFFDTIFELGPSAA